MVDAKGDIGQNKDDANWRAEASADAGKGKELIDESILIDNAEFNENRLRKADFARRAYDLTDTSAKRDQMMSLLDDPKRALKDLAYKRGAKIDMTLLDERKMNELEHTLREEYDLVMAEQLRRGQELVDFALHPKLFEERFGFAATEEQVVALKAKAEPFMLTTDSKSLLDSLTARTQVAPTASPASAPVVAPPPAIK